jgi:uncharacterized repeat protein (TIGR01451 family)
MNNPLPDGVVLRTVTTTHGFYDQTSGRNVTVQVGSLGMGEVASIRILVSVVSSASISNTATVTASEPDPDTNNNSATVVFTPLLREADLGVTQVVQPATPYVGESTDYVITVSNAGPDPAGNAIVLDTLSTNMLYLNASSSQGTIDIVEGNVIADLGELGVGGTATVTITVILKSDHPNTENVVTVTSTQPDPDTGNNRSTLAVSPGYTRATLDYSLNAQGGIVLSWPAYPESWNLQYTTGLSPNPQWVYDSQIPFVQEGRKNVIINPSAGSDAERYYRVESF